MRRSAAARTNSSSWVATMIVRPPAASPRRTCAPDRPGGRRRATRSARPSAAPAGSTASARAMATRCASPPDSSCGLAAARCPTPSDSRSAAACALGVGARAAQHVDRRQHTRSRARSGARTDGGTEKPCRRGGAAHGAPRRAAAGPGRASFPRRRSCRRRSDRGRRWREGASSCPIPTHRSSASSSPEAASNETSRTNRPRRRAPSPRIGRWTAPTTSAIAAPAGGPAAPAAATAPGTSPRTARRAPASCRC